MVPRVQRIPNRSDPATPTGLWRPLLDGAWRERALETVGAIAECLRDWPVRDASLAGGTAGLAVFHTYLAQCGCGPGDGTAERLVGCAITAAVASPLDPSLYGGL